MALTIPAKDDGTPFILELSTEEMMDSEKVKRLCEFLCSMSEQLVSKKFISQALIPGGEPTVLFTLTKDR